MNQARVYGYHPIIAKRPASQPACPFAVPDKQLFSSQSLHRSSSNSSILFLNPCSSSSPILPSCFSLTPPPSRPINSSFIPKNGTPSAFSSLSVAAIISPHAPCTFPSYRSSSRASASGSYIHQHPATHRTEVKHTERCVDAATWPPSPFLPLSSTSSALPIIASPLRNSEGGEGEGPTAPRPTSPSPPPARAASERAPPVRATMSARGRAVLGLDAGGGAFFRRLGRVRGCGGGRGARWLWMLGGGGEAGG